ncbi:DUF6371 domain-containing protein [Mariniflexile sp. AS56]|uniref:DUF6371 domain-containing protein n=1 Tax=Mariniflexile sp. AS56 TaxID=3063957 RepID=UPI0026EA1B26|nr:DUF6371 domain-containing protein [Mariniflexile sp. AS56]MDO7173455.1 DUF6371 domain-containing protein [Mariniflexile sp. AS56]
MLKKLNIKYSFEKKRNFNITTPCCNNNNKDGKFVNYQGLPINYGYCHSCGKASLPTQIYKDDKGDHYLWDEITSKFINFTNDIIPNRLIKNEKQISNPTENRTINYVSEVEIWKHYLIEPENNLLKYLRKTYGNKKVDLVKEMYVIGTCTKGGTVFWNISKELNVQKSKVCFYDTNGKRTNRFQVPYKNEDGFYSCLFGEHLILDKYRGKQILVLVESEKTAIVGDICMPKYTWLAYGGSNGLTEGKLKPLIGHKVLIIPDISRTATDIMLNKIPYLIKLGINAKVWDMTYGKSDEELNEEGVYNKDLEDLIRDLINY